MKKIALATLMALALQPAIAADSQTTEQTAEATPAATMALPAAKRVDEDADMEKSMKKMGKNFKKLKKADDVADMKAPAEELAIYASQSQAIAEEMAQGLEKLRMGIAQLQTAIDNGDEAQAKAIIEKLNEGRKKAHSYFGVN